MRELEYKTKDALFAFLLSETVTKQEKLKAFEELCCRYKEVSYYNTLKLSNELDKINK